MNCFKIRFWTSKFQSESSNPGIEPKSLWDETRTSPRRTSSLSQDFTRKNLAPHQQQTPSSQRQLLIHAPKESYKIVEDAPIPTPSNNREAIIQIQTIGLNPIDWKSPAFNFGLPSLPCVLGRDYVGIVLKEPLHSSRIQSGDIVIATSTDYRDYRKAAFQEYAIGQDFNLCRLPRAVHPETTAAIGVAFVTAAITLGVCLGLHFKDGPDLHPLVRSINRDSLPEDIQDECHSAMENNERIQSGDWLAIWGAGSTIGFFALQLAKMAGVRVACVADIIKRGALLKDAGADLLVHRAHTEEASGILRSVTRGELRFGIDTVGKDTSAILQDTLGSKAGKRAHIVGLTGLPKSKTEGIIQHKVPIKIFHEQPPVGEAIMVWMEDLLATGRLLMPEVDVHPETGLDSVNGALERLKAGEVQGHRIVVRMSDEDGSASAHAPESSAIG